MSEAFVPLPDGRRIPVAMQGKGGGGTVAVAPVINVHNHAGAKSRRNDAGREWTGSD